MSATVRLTQFSHGAGCGCKISPEILSTILAGSGDQFSDPNLLVGNASRDDAAVYQINGVDAVVSTTDFFMPIVDDPFDFGRIAATNAISDIYAMGARPLMAIAILGWPLDKLSPEIAADVIRGGRAVCDSAGIVLAGGHSIDAPEPIFGLAVTGQVKVAQIKRNDRARAGDLLFLTKPLGVGILTTAEKQGKLRPEDRGLATQVMCQLNDVGLALAEIDGVHAVTDVTGFGLFGHLVEMADGAQLHAQVHWDKIPRLAPVLDYLSMACIPGGTHRNFQSYGARIAICTDEQRHVLCDPQTSGGLLIAVDPKTATDVQQLLDRRGFPSEPIGHFQSKSDYAVTVV